MHRLPTIQYYLKCGTFRTKSIAETYHGRNVPAVQRRRLAEHVFNNTRLWFVTCELLSALQNITNTLEKNQSCIEKIDILRGYQSSWYADLRHLVRIICLYVLGIICLVER